MCPQNCTYPARAANLSFALSDYAKVRFVDSTLWCMPWACLCDCRFDAQAASGAPSLCRLKRWATLHPVLGEAIKDCYVLALDIAVLFEALLEREQTFNDRLSRSAIEESDRRDGRLLCPHHVSLDHLVGAQQEAGRPKGGRQTGGRKAGHAVEDDQTATSGFGPGRAALGYPAHGGAPSTCVMARTTFPGPMRWRCAAAPTVRASTSVPVRTTAQ
jgi:hypothetical protein